MSLLQTLYRGEWLRNVDVALAKSLQRARSETPDWVLVAAALTSRAVANGHSQLPLTRVRDLLLEIASDREFPALPPVDEWLTLLRASPWVATVGSTVTVELNDRVLVLEGDALSLRRYWQYEVRLAAALSARLAAPIRPHDSQALEARVTQLFTADPGNNAQASATIAEYHGINR